MTYKGYAVRIEYSEEDGCFVGHLVGMRSIVGFDGKSVTELRKHFHQGPARRRWCHNLRAAR